MIRRPPRSTRTDTPFPTRRSSDLPCTVQALRSPRAPARPALSATAGLHESDASTRLLAHAKEERCTGRMSLLHLPIGPVPFVVANSGVAQQWVLSHGGRVDRTSTRLNSSH